MTDYSRARRNMIDGQLRPNGVRHTPLLQAFEAIPREHFVPASRRGIAYIDEDLKVGPNRYLIEPMVLALMMQACNPQPDDTVLDVGCATGYSTAILAQLAHTAIGLESDKALAEEAQARLTELPVDNAVVVQNELPKGYKKKAPYNVILINGQIDAVPKALTDQLAEGGRLACVIDTGGHFGEGILYERIAGYLSHRGLFNASTQRLPGFESRPTFVF